MLRPLLVSLTLTLALILPVQAQDRAQTLADMRAELLQLAQDLAALKAELTASGNGGGTMAGSVLDRVSALDAEIVRLTARTEELDLKINRVISDGTNRIADLEYRIVEMEGGDVSKLQATAPLGGQTVVGTPAPTGQLPGTAAVAGPELAIGERMDYDAAKAKFDAGDAQGAADALLTFNETYPGSPMAADAFFLRGEALASLGQGKDAARAYLFAFSANETGPRAPAALFKLGLALDALGQRIEGCQMLGAVTSRFPGTPEATQAQTSMAGMACG